MHRAFTLTRAVVVLAAWAACAPTPKHPIEVGVLIDGEPTPLPAVTGLSLHAADLTAAPPAAADTAGPAIAAARKAYATGDHATCRETIGKLDVAALLAAGNRAAVARALSLDAACAYQGSGPDEAKRIAARLAAFGLELPADAVAREVEDVILAEITAAGSARHAQLVVTGVAGARVGVDGKPAACTARCTLDLVAGEHVIAVDTDGFDPAWKLVRVPELATLDLSQQAASAGLAAAQWRARIGRGLDPVDPTGAKLLALAAHEPRIIYLHIGAGVAGSLVIDGVRAASASDDRGAGARLVRELAYDGKLLHRPTVFQRPSTWIGIAAAALVTSAIIVYVTYQPEVETKVGF